MKQLLTIILFIGLFQSQTYAQPDFSNLIDIQPNPAMEGQMVTIGFITGCRNWTDHNFIVNGFVINYEVTYHGCYIGVPPPEYFNYYDLGELPAGDYQLNLTITEGVASPIQYQETITFGVLPVKSVPVASNFAYWLLLSLTLLFGILWLKRSHRMRDIE